ncbi:MAG: PAS domain S-box protein [Solirubrobacteraceae bacterium]
MRERCWNRSWGHHTMRSSRRRWTGSSRSGTRRLSEMLGFTAAEAIGRPVSITNVGAEQDAERTEVRRRIVSGEALVELDTNLRTKSGQIIDVTLRISPLRDPRGRVVGLSAVVRDTTERKRSERALAEFAAIVESSYDAIIGTSLDGVVTSWNPAAERLYGYRAAEAIGRPLTSLVSSERDAVERAEILRRLAEGEQLMNVEATRHTKGGERVEVELTVSTVRDRQGQPVGFGSVVRDITERKRNERAVAQLAAIVESSYDAIIGVTREGVITSWNPAAERLYGYSAGEAIGRTMSSLAPSESHADDRAEVIRRPSASSATARRKPSDGRSRASSAPTTTRWRLVRTGSDGSSEAKHSPRPRALG